MVLPENITVTNISVEEVSKSQQQVNLKFTCLNCDYFTNDAMTLNKHVNDRHKALAQEIKFICAQCDHVLDQEKNYNIHLKEHDKSELLLLEPRDMVKDNTVKDSVCHFCTFTTSNLENLKVHILNSHIKETEAEVSCPI